METLCVVPPDVAAPVGTGAPDGMLDVAAAGPPEAERCDEPAASVRLQPHDRRTAVTTSHFMSPMIRALVAPAAAKHVAREGVIRVYRRELGWGSPRATTDWPMARRPRK